MRSLLISSCIIMLLATACNQQKAATSSKALTDLAGENLQGNIAQVEADTYSVDSTGTDSLESKDIEKYDTSGYEISYVSMNGKDSIMSQTTFQHNDNGYPTHIETTGANNEKKSSVDLQYDSLGKFSIVKVYDSAGNMTTYYTDITTNKYGEVTGAKGYHPDSTLKMSFQNYFDSIYNVGGFSKDSIGKITYAGFGTLNDKNNMAKYADTTVTADPKTKQDTTKTTSETYTYDNYDSHGNWTQRTTTNENGKPTKIVKRIITYRE